MSMRECDGDGNAGEGDGGSVTVSSGHEYVGGSGIVSSAADVLGMNVVRGVDGLCEMGMCLIGAVWEVRG